MYWPALMASISMSIRFLLAVIRRAAMIAIRFPLAVIDSGIQSLPSKVLPVGDPACLSGAPEVQYHLSATLAGQQVRTSSGARSEERRVGKECRSRWSP